MNTEKNYDIFYKKIRDKFGGYEKQIRVTNKILTGITYVSYPVFLALLFFTKDKRFLKCVAVPAVGFVLLTLFRKAINRSRPYEKFKIEPIIKKDTKGKSMPSRHIYSITVIAMTFLYVYRPLGILFLLFSAFLAVIRVIGGVHYPTDVSVGYILGLLTGLILFII